MLNAKFNQSTLSIGLMRALALLCFSIAAGVVSAELTPADLAKLYAKPSPFENVETERYVAESENAFVIRDKYPQAPVHLLIIPKKRVPTVLQASPELTAEMIMLAKKAAKQEGIENNGFRMVINTHPSGGQSVFHFHIHVLGGRQMQWPPG